MTLDRTRQRVGLLDQFDAARDDLLRSKLGEDYDQLQANENPRAGRDAR